MFRKTLTLTLALTLTSTVALASTWSTCSSGAKRKWKDAKVVLYPSPVDFYPNTSYGNAMKESIDSFNDTPSNFKYVLEYDFDQLKKINLGNGRSETWLSNGITAAGVCYSWTNSNCELVETDVVLKKSISWTTSKTKTENSEYGGSKVLLQSVALHELGHAQGLGHTADTYSIMGMAYSHLHTNGTQALAYPGQDAVFASMATYGKKTIQFEDVAVSHWRWVGSSAGYSTHARTRVLDESKADTLPKKIVNAEPVYTVKAGQKIYAEYTFENLGKTAQGFQVGYYLSTDSFISTADTLIQSAWMITGADKPFTFAQQITIPSWVVPGKTYWLGAYCDYNDTIPESTSNNATYIAIQVLTPDLAAKSIVGPTTAKQGSIASVQLAFGDANHVPSFGYSIVLTKDGVVGPDDIVVHSGTMSSLQPLAQSTASVTIPAALKKGNYYWALVVNGAAGEIVTSNNTLIGGKVKIKNAKN